MKPKAYFLALLFSPQLLFAQQTTQPPPPTPDISISANGGSANLYSGWPLIVHLTIQNSNSLNPNANAPLVISVPNGVWTDAISFTSLNGAGSPASWPLHLVGTPSDSVLSLAPPEYVQLTWQMSPADVSILPHGDYLLSATIQVANSTGWNGVVQTIPVAITVGPEPALTPDLQAEKTFQSAEFAVNTGDFFTAVTATQQLRLNQPDNPGAAAIAAGILNEAGYPSLAFLQQSSALDTFYRVNPNPPEAPFNLLPSFQDLLTTMATPDDTVLPTSTLESTSSLTFSPNSQSLSLAANVSSSAPVNGGTVTFTITGIAGSATSPPVNAGSAAALFTVPGGTQAGSYSIHAAYGGTPGFTGSSDSSASLVISRATPTITWNNPADITQGAALGASQLNATANVPGVFTYLPASGTVLSAGAAQALAVTFTPADSVDYNSATAAVKINVKPKPAPIPGDLNGDGVVNCGDLNIVKAAFNKKTGQVGFDPRADINHDGVVNILDLSYVARQLPAGTVCQ